MEQYQACREDVDYPYLAPVRDWLPIDDEYEDSDLTVEENAEKWIENQPEAFCNTNDKRSSASVFGLSIVFSVINTILSPKGSL